MDRIKLFIDHCSLLTDMSLEDEFKHREKLAKMRRPNVKKIAQKNHQDLKKFDKNKKSISKMSLVSCLELTDVFFIFAITMAILKDILDFTGVGSLPLIGTLITIIVSITIAVAMFIGGSSVSRRSAKNIFLKRWGTLGAGTIVEFLFGVNFLPIETLTSIIVFYMTLARRKEAGENDQVTKRAMEATKQTQAASPSESMSKASEISSVRAADDYDEEKTKKAA